MVTRNLGLLARAACQLGRQGGDKVAEAEPLLCIHVRPLRTSEARKWDHAQLVHHQWMCAAKLQISVFVKRVATNDNLADLPSRKEFGPMTRMGMQEMDPVLVDADLDLESWAELAERWKV